MTKEDQKHTVTVTTSSLIVPSDSPTFFFFCVETAKDWSAEGSAARVSLPAMGPLLRNISEQNRVGVRTLALSTGYEDVRALGSAGTGPCCTRAVGRIPL